ncbi:hypothetical protein MPER_12253 [Moniliophthora perniciosa FA553]|nr:hypothetical protein MPER_12253 [Moniliophthora perniciosa FA553]
MTDILRRSTRIRTLPPKDFAEMEDEGGLSDSNQPENVSMTKSRETKRKRQAFDGSESEDDSVANGVEFRTSKSSAKKPANRTRKSGGQPKRSAKLSLLPTMPLDVLYVDHQIFGYLPPKSLLALIRVNRAFRETLLAPNTLSIWIATRKSCKAPDPLPGKTEVEWAQILFGNHYCQVCGARGAHRIVFLLQKRICYACVRSTGASEEQFKRMYPGVNSIVLDLVFPVAGDQNKRTVYYSRSEIEQVIKELNACGGSIPAEKQYIDQRRKYLKEIKEVASSSSL